MSLSRRERAKLAAIAASLSDDDPHLAGLLSSRWHSRGVCGRSVWFASMLALGIAPFGGVVGIRLHSLVWMGTTALGIVLAITGVVCIVSPVSFKGAHRQGSL